MTSLGRMAGVSCCRHSPVLFGLHSRSGGGGVRTMASISSSQFAFPAGRSLASVEQLYSSSHKVTFSLCAVVGVRSGFAKGGRASYGGSSSSNRAAMQSGQQGQQYGYQQQGGQGQQSQQSDKVEYPRPQMIQWEKNLANAVQLIGNVGREVNLKYLDSGKVLARTSIAVKRNTQKDEDPSWFELEIWDNLAEVAARHIKKGEKIFVMGTIVLERWMKDEVPQLTAKVVVRDICFVEPYRGSQANSRQDYGFQDGGSSQQNWNQQPVSRQAPEGTSSGEGGSSKNYEDENEATEKKWQEFFADPTQWWDNRTNKRNPKGPDFKHKSTAEVLWIKSWNNPPWVEKQLAVWEEKKAQVIVDSGDSEQPSKGKTLSSFKESDYIF